MLAHNFPLPQACMMLHRDHYKVTVTLEHGGDCVNLLTSAFPQRFLEDDEEEEEEEVSEEAEGGAAAEKDVTKEAVKK
jgi:hypothetical protein